MSSIAKCEDLYENIDKNCKTAFIDGACANNGKPNAKGGCGVHWVDQPQWDVSCRLPGPLNTNNRAELTAAIIALERILYEDIRDNMYVVTDSTYVKDGLTNTSWLALWKKNGWLTTLGAPVKNKDLWQELSVLIEKLPSVCWVWVPAAHKKAAGDKSIPNFLLEGNAASDDLARSGSKLLDNLPSWCVSGHDLFMYSVELKKGSGIKPKVSSSSSNSGSDSAVVESKDGMCFCKKLNTNEMIQCNLCRKWVHFWCTLLPPYQLFILSTTTRLYTCAECVDLPDRFWKPDGNPKAESSSHNKGIGMDQLKGLMSHLQNELIVSFSASINAMEQNVATALNKSIEDHRSVVQSQSKVVSTNDECEKCVTNIKELCAVKADIAKLSAELQDSKKCRDSLKREKQEVAHKAQLDMASLEASKRRDIAALEEAMRIDRERVVILSEDVDRLQGRLTESRNLASELEDKNTALRKQTSDLSDEIISLKLHMSRESNALLREDNADKLHSINGTSKSGVTSKRKVLLLGSSQTKDLKEDKLSSPDFDVERRTAYTISEAQKLIDDLPAETGSDVVVLHVITNDVKVASAEEVATEMKSLVKSINGKKPQSKVVLSLGPPRDDNRCYKLKTQLANAILLEEFKASASVTLVPNENLGLRDGRINDELFVEDKIHLSPDGTKLLASNIKQAIRQCLGIEIRRHDSPKPKRSRNNQNHQSRDNPRYFRNGNGPQNWDNNSRYHYNQRQQNLSYYPNRDNQRYGDNYNGYRPNSPSNNWSN